MACKCKSYPKPYESEYEGRKIDLRGFAYDVFKFSAQKFGVPSEIQVQSCTNEALENDYGHPDFLSAIFRFLFRQQVKIRFDCKILFKEYCENNKLETLKNVRELWSESLRKTKYQTSELVQNIRLSLALSNELILFFDSKLFHFHEIAKELAVSWYHWILVRKFPFEEAGGIGLLYTIGRMSEYRLDDAFNAKYIPIKCISYEDSSKNPDLFEEMRKLFRKYQEVAKECDIIRGVVRHDSPQEWKFVDNPYETSAQPLTSEHNTASGIDIPENTVLGITPHEEWLRHLGMAAGAEATPSQIRPEAYLQEPTRHRKQKKLMGTYRQCRSLGQAVNQMSVHSLAAKQSTEDKSSISGTHHAIPSQNQTEAISKDPARHRLGSTGEQKRKCSSLQYVEQAVSQFSLHTLAVKQSAEDNPSICGTHHAIPSQNQTEAITKDPVKNRIGSTCEQKSQKSKCSSLKNVEQAISQLSLDSLAAKQSSDNELNISGTHATQPQYQTGAIPEVPARHRRRSSHKHKEQKGKNRQCPSFEQGLRRV